ncbi:MAG TPA: chloride channel protein [Bryobacteraceae bacterium]|nr:chloride channel protein [Bryobacteraceae bacterium]
MAHWFRSLQDGQYEDKVLLVLTLIIGAIVGLVVVAFILLTENLGSRLYPAGGAAWRRLVIPVIGSLVTGFFLARNFPDARGSGIPQTKVALFLKDGFISLRTVLGKFSMCSITLASGIALGREGPSVHVSAGIASVLGRRLGLSPRGVKALIPIGAAAALAAAFNTPIAAVLFTLEEVMGDMHAPVLGSVVLSSATSWIVLHLLLGDEPLFHVPSYQLVHPAEFLVYALLGVMGGLVSAFFVKLLLWQRKQFLGLPNSTKWLQPAAGGLLVGVLGWYVPGVLGVGYGFVDQALNGKMLIATMAMLVFLKIAATSTCYASGNAGGIFGPSLFMGAMMGGAVGGVAHMLLPDYTGSVGAYALVGMGAAFAGIIRVPLTSVIMIFEITRDYTIIVPLMIANLISYFVSSRLQEEPIYEALQHQDGIHLPSGARAREDLLTVAHGFRAETPVLLATINISHAAASVDRGQGTWPVSDQNGLRGMVTLAQLDQAIKDERGGQLLSELVPEPGPVEMLTQENFPHVHPDHPLDIAMRRMAETKLTVLPVVSRTNVRDLKGTISMQDVLDTYALGGRQERPKASGAETKKIPVKLFTGVLAALLGLALLMGFLNYFYREQRTGRAQQYYQEATDLMQKERYEEAIARYREALSVSHSVDYRLALGLALVKGGHPREASIYLNQVLHDRPLSSVANLGLARTSVETGDVSNAVLHYQRAILGGWPEKTGENRFQTHIELVQVLEKAGRHEQARAELLSIAATLPDQSAMKKQVGRMLIDYGLPAEAVKVYDDLLQQGQHDADAYNGLGDAEFALEDYAKASEAYRGSLAIAPGDDAGKKRLDTCDRVLAMDPTIPGLDVGTRYKRSQALLSSALDEVLRCAGDGATGEEAEQAKKAIGHRKKSQSFSDAAEEGATLAQRLWAARPPSCSAGDATDALNRVMTKLAHH